MTTSNLNPVNYLARYSDPHEAFKHMLDDYPDLTAHGFPDHRADNRARLVRDRERVIALAQWMSAHFTPSKGRAMHSYEWKHVLERAYDSAHDGRHHHVGNGLAIAAVFLCGWPWRPDSSPTPNVYLAISARDVRRLERGLIPAPPLDAPLHRPSARRRDFGGTNATV